MAQTFADNLFDIRIAGKNFGKDLNFSQLNPLRPNLVINATRGSANFTKEGEKENSFGQPFTFTEEDFKNIDSSIAGYELSRGVMASATFPGVFNFMTLKNFKKEGEYVHLFDGGNLDNLGLTSIKRLIWTLHEDKLSNDQSRLKDYDKIIVILVDAYTNASGVSAEKPDPRNWYDFMVDSNFIVAVDSLLSKNRENLLTQFETKTIFPYTSAGEKEKDKTIEACKNFFHWKDAKEAIKLCSDSPWDTLNSDIGEKMEFVHITFDEITSDDKEGKYLKHQLNNIPTDFKLDNKKDEKTGLTAKEAITCVVPTLFNDSNKEACKGKSYSASEKLKKKWEDVLKAFSNPSYK